MNKSQSFITVYSTKHIGSWNGMDIFSFKILINDTTQPVECDPKWHTFTCKGDNLGHVKENRVYTLSVEKMPDTKKYTNQYKANLITAAYPNDIDEQYQFLEKLCVLLRLSNEQVMSTLAYFDKHRTKQMDVIHYIKENMSNDEPWYEKSTLNKKLKSLSAFSKIYQYLIESGLNNTVALKIANASNVKLDLFKNNQNNLYKIYYNERLMPFYELETTHNFLNPNEPLSFFDKYVFNSAIRHTLENILNQTGVTTVNQEQLIMFMTNEFGNSDQIRYHIENFEKLPNSNVILIDASHTTDNLIYFSLSTVYYGTMLIKNHIKHTNEIKKPVKLHNIEEKLGIDYILTDEQLDAVEKSVSGGLICLTGAAGTGKSATLNVIMRQLETIYKKDEIVKMAPTAKAADVLTKYTKSQARTIDSWLTSAEKTEPDTIDVKYLIIDEASMVDEKMFVRILKIVKAVEEETGNMINIILSGDVAQLLPVNYGAPFRDLLNRYPEIVCRLTIIHRQKNPELIDQLQLARNGDFQLTKLNTLTNNYYQVNNRIAYTYYANPMQVVELLKYNIKTYSYDEFSKYGIVSPIKNNVSALNTALQCNLNPNFKNANLKVKRIVGNTEQFFALGDPVVLTKNNKTYINATSIANKYGIKDLSIVSDNTKTYFSEQFEKDYVTNTENTQFVNIPNDDTVTGKNGAFGFVKAILSDKLFVIQVIVNIKPVNILVHTSHITFNNIELAYAITIHKSQGSQFEHVIYVNTRNRESMSSRNMVYTAMSRAKTDIIILSNSQFSNELDERQTLLDKLIIESRHETCKTINM